MRGEMVSAYGAMLGRKRGSESVTHHIRIIMVEQDQIQ